MLMVAPSGRTDEAIDLLTPRFWVAHDMVIGSVAFEEEVEKATAWASTAPLKKSNSGRRRMTLMMNPKVKSMCSAQAM